MSITVTLLEKSVKLPIGTRRIYGTGKNMQWFRKAPNGKWEYDGQVSPTERVEEEKKQKTKTRAKKLRVQSKKKIAEIQQKIADKDSDDGSTSTQTTSKPDAKTLVTLPKKEQMYYEDNTTDRARDLCDKTGILCIDTNAEDYLERNLTTIFKLSKDQQDVIDGLSVMTPAGTDGKWADDPIFVEDTLNMLKNMQKDMNTDKYIKDIHKRFSSMNVSEVDALIVNTDQALEKWISMLEGRENDKIVFSKLRALEKGMQGLYTIDGIVSSILDSFIPSYASGTNWRTLTDVEIVFFNSIGINEDNWNTFRHIERQELQAMVGASLQEGEVETVLRSHLEDKGWTDKHLNNYYDYNQGGGYTQVSASNPNYVDPVKLFEGLQSLKPKYKSISNFLDKFIKQGVISASQISLTDVSKSSFFNLMRDAAGSNFDTPLVLKPDIDLSWREIGTDLKSMMRSKNVNWDRNKAIFKTITDTAKVMGNTSLEDSTVVATNKVKQFTDALSDVSSTYIKAGNSEVSSYVGNVASGGRYWRSYAHPSSPPHEGFIYYKSLSVKKKYGSTAMTSSRYWRKEKIGETRKLKGVLRSTALDVSSIRSNYTYVRGTGTDTHSGVSIAMAVGMNWQNRKLTKKSQVVPDWTWGALKPLSKINKVSTDNENYLYSDSKLIGNQLYADHVKAMKENSIIKHMGLTSGNVQTHGKQKPKLVLRTSAEGTNSWQDKVDNSWTHGSAFIKGSVKVKNVFDIMYHDYYKDYKEVEQKVGNVQYQFHGTDFEAGASIIKGGYRVVPRSKAKAGRSLGDGLYTTPSSSKASGYFFKDNWGRRGEGVLFWNRIAMGKQNKDGDNYYTATNDPSYDSVYLKGSQNGGSSAFQYDEYCTKNAKAIIPINWIEVGPA